MPEYIERKAAIAAIYAQHVGGKKACENARPNTFGADLREIVSDIEDIPAADVRPVVLCKDCRHRDPEDHRCDSGDLERAGCVFTVADDYFCAYGERKNSVADMREVSDDA